MHIFSVCQSLVILLRHQTVNLSFIKQCLQKTCPSLDLELLMPPSMQEVDERTHDILKVEDAALSAMKADDGGAE